MTKRIEELLKEMVEQNKSYTYSEIKAFLDIYETYPSGQLGKIIRLTAKANNIVIETKEKKSVTYLTAKKLDK